MKVRDLFVRHAAAPPARKATDNPARLLQVHWTGRAIAPVSYHEAVVAHAAMAHPIVHRCLNKLGSSVQTATWYAEKDGRDSRLPSDKRAWTSADEKALESLLASPNNDMTAAELRYWAALSLACFGIAYFKVGRGIDGRPNGLYPLDAPRMRPIIAANGLIRGYSLQPNGEAVDFMTREEAAKRDDPEKHSYHPYVVRIAIPGLLFTPTGLALNSPLQSLGMPAQIISLLMQRAIDTASGHPNSRYMVTADQLLTRPQEEELARNLERREAGGEDAGRVLFIAGANVKTAKLDNDLTDIHSKMPMDDMARQIAGGFGIPIALIGLGAADGAKFAGNYIESRRAFWEDTVDPCYLKPIEEGLTKALCPPGMSIKFDRDTIPALQDARVEKAAKLEKITFLTEDEKRELAGFPPRPAGAPAPAKSELAQPAKAA